MQYTYKFRRNNVNSQSVWFSNIKYKHKNKWANTSELPGSLNKKNFLKFLNEQAVKDRINTQNWLKPVQESSKSPTTGGHSETL